MQVSFNVDISRNMDETSLVLALRALGQRTRFEAFRRLLAADSSGITAGELAHQCGVPHNTMSVHLAMLTAAGLLQIERTGRVKIIRANWQRLLQITELLTRYCSVRDSA
jgi:DNA-binding transcriptional ArsR family regulator